MRSIVEQMFGELQYLRFFLYFHRRTSRRRRGGCSLNVGRSKVELLSNVRCPDSYPLSISLCSLPLVSICGNRDVLKGHNHVV